MLLWKQDSRPVLLFTSRLPKRNYIFWKKKRDNTTWNCFIMLMLHLQTEKKSTKGNKAFVSIFNIILYKPFVYNTKKCELLTLVITWQLTVNWLELEMSWLRNKHFKNNNKKNNLKKTHNNAPLIWTSPILNGIT